jgi:hypothetical protein
VDRTAPRSRAPLAVTSRTAGATGCARWDIGHPRDAGSRDREIADHAQAVHLDLAANEGGLRRYVQRIDERPRVRAARQAER